MLYFGIFYEIVATIRKNKLRTVLTGFSVAWGIFMLIILLGAGNGLENGVNEEFKDDAINSIWIYPGQTSIPHKGMKAGRRIRFTNDDHDRIKQKTPEVEHITSRLYIRGSNVTYKNEFVTWKVIAVHPGIKYIEEVQMIEGRYINDLDIKNYRKNVVISYLVRDMLFKDDTTDALGKYVNVSGIPFKVVGVFRDESYNDNRRVYIPVSTGQRIYSKNDNRINNLAFTTAALKTEETKVIEESLRHEFSKRHKFNIEDKRAIWIRNNMEEYEQYLKLFNGISLFIWIIGIFTLIAGVVGVSNIMIITVKERTKEIGVRKAIGATPGSIVWLVLLESLIIMVIAGYIGLVMGIGLLEFLSPKFADSGTFFKNPGVDINIAMYATALLIICGAIAGFFPARRAAKIKPVIALRDE
jgi:putative ABC transport system permease protein